jgi:hypothetical protein
MCGQVERPERTHHLCDALLGRAARGLTAVRAAFDSDAHLTQTAAQQLVVLSNQLVGDGLSNQLVGDGLCMAEDSPRAAGQQASHESELTHDVRQLWGQLLPLAVTAPAHTVRMLVEHAVANLQQVDLVVALLRLLPSLARCGDFPVPACPSYVAAALAAVLQSTSNLVPAALLRLVTRLVVHDDAANAGTLKRTGPQCARIAAPLCFAVCVLTLH